MVDVAAQSLEFIGDLTAHRRARQEPDVAAARPPFQQAEFAETGNAGESVDRDLQRWNLRRILVRNVVRFA